ncbi:putative RNA-directed DNA polymerase [Helianthus annuus]|nr:putative RNA-directed DNA polymerase [Helianthus annuus]
MIDGTWVTAPPLIKDFICSFFAQKFQEPSSNRPGLLCPNLKQISDNQAGMLVAPFTLEEIKSAVWDCEGDKAPGPDGINFKFIRKCWEFLQADFVAVFEDFKTNGTISMGCTSSFIALIPKCRDPDGLGDYRPISLVGCINKVVSKVLANRLKLVIDNLVSEEQTAFIAGRSILDGPLILNELIPWMKQKKKEGFIFKADMEKAYDSLNWRFLESIMEQMSFPLTFIKWIMATVNCARASVLVNGSPTQEFSCHRGLRQGDPLSPFLFIIAMEALTGVMKKACNLGIYEGVRLSNQGLVMSHFMYADDVIFLGNWSSNCVLNLTRILRCFYLASGLRVSLVKSSFFGVNVGNDSVQEVAGLLGCRVGCFPFKHLGLQVGANMNLVKHWQPVVEVFKKRLALWKAKTLSFGGRLTLTMSVLNALPTYYFSLYKAPSGVIDQLERLRREFLWGITPEKKKLCLIAWNNVLTPKDSGGVGLSSLKDANLAMLAKWWWRFKTEPDSLWRRVIWSIHHSERNWNPIPRKVSISGPWKQVFNVSKDIMGYGLNLQECFRANIGLGESVLFWKERWIEGVTLQRKFPCLFSLEGSKNAVVADRMKMVNGAVVLNFSWVRQPESQDEMVELQELSQLLSSVVGGQGADRWEWELDNSGRFSVKSLKSWLQCARFSDIGNEFVWNNWLPLKVNFLAWRLSLERLPTLAALARRSAWSGQTECRVCNQLEENVDHLFIGCELAQTIWNFVSTWCKVSNIYAFRVKDLLNWHKNVKGNRRWRKLIYAVMQVALWVIWQNRNKLIFQGKEIRVDRLKEEIKQLGFLWIGSRSNLKDITWEEWCKFDVSSKC